MFNQKPKPGIYMTLIDVCPVCQGKSSPKTSIITPLNFSNPKDVACQACGGHGFVAGLVPAHEYILQFLIHLGVPINPDVIKTLIDDHLKKAETDSLNLKDNINIVVNKKGEA